MAHSTFRRSKPSFLKSSRAGIAAGRRHEEQPRPRLLSTIQPREMLALRRRLLNLRRRIIHQSPSGRQSQHKAPLPLHGYLKLTGDVCRGVTSVHNLETSESLKHSAQWRGGELVHVRKLGNSNVAVLNFEGRNVPRYVHYNAELTPAREYKKTVPACYRCGTLGHRADNCPNPLNERCGLCGQNVGAGTEGMAPDECNPMCIVRGARTLPVPANASGNSSDFSSQGPGHRGPPQHRGASQLERRQSRHPRAPFPARRGSFTPPGGSNRGVTPPPDKKAAATPLPGEAEFPALCAPAGHATRNQPKVGSWAKVASSPPPHPSCPTSTAETQELKHELSLLRAQNENTASERNLLRTQFGTPLSSSGEEENIPDRQLPTPSESRVVAQETQVTETERHLAGLPKIVHYTIARQMDSVIIQVTQAVTRIIQKWIQDNPRVLKRVEPIRDDNRSSNFSRVIPDESDFSEDSCTSALGTSELGSVNNVTPASMTDLGPQPKVASQSNSAAYTNTVELQRSQGPQD
ncbi:hypothetical protein HPB49_025204 [Dermacentor silvarum]|uniref:Uncharacterized protein n=1 Tax=Dermacentor silvarum TaxID=543639 RepID=A0ACB8DHM4_DERSI|nr:hypothetical protein HPB49_025204 [Dermacentor silvarum]